MVKENVSTDVAISADVPHFLTSITMRLIVPFVKNYAWGAIDKNAVAHRFAPLAPPGDPVAELWVGDHPSGPAIFEDTGETVHLPYLLKVLSVRKALSIQVHPSKPQAEELHARDPLNYPDDNHKPEMLVALSRFEALVGFNENFSVDEMFRLLSSKEEPEDDAIARNYPGDPSVLVAQRLMNRVVLEPGECLVIPPGVVHAYLSGDGVEVMAKSDNVVRMGLTTKFCDRKAFMEIAILKPTPPDVRRGKTFENDLIGCTVEAEGTKGVVVDVASGSFRWVSHHPVISIRSWSGTEL